MGRMGKAPPTVGVSGRRAIEKVRKKTHVEKPLSHGKNEGRTLSAHQEKLRKRLESGQFRELNERLYTCTGAQAAVMLQAQPQLFTAYHSGYDDQVRRWPFNPLDRVIAYLRIQEDSLRVADLGCGQARLASETPQRVIHSFDLVAANDRVVACDIAHLPLDDSCVDVAVFCLSLMGTNYGEYLVEARRVLCPQGWVLIAEVGSRFTDDKRRQFIRGVEVLGFRSDTAHPFVSGSLPGMRGSAGTVCLNGRAFQANSQRRKSTKKDKKTIGTSLKVSSSDFFVLFAFQSTKKAGGTGKKRERGPARSNLANLAGEVPELKSCIYKKR